ncbi:hypothetical protein HDV00_009071 [Rhizophlyctis rosea]|nr:hypothetical protein HDV00_009071 [Rhizophlyctis rosea]
MVFRFPSKFYTNSETYEKHKNEPYTFMAEDVDEKIDTVWRPYILLWILDGLRRYNEVRFSVIPAVCRNWRQGLVAQQDTVTPWLQDNVETGTAAHTLRGGWQKLSGLAESLSQLGDGEDQGLTQVTQLCCYSSAFTMNLLPSQTLRSAFPVPIRFLSKKPSISASPNTSVVVPGGDEPSSDVSENGRGSYHAPYGRLANVRGHGCERWSKGPSVVAQDGQKPLSKKGQMLLSIAPVNDEDLARIKSRIASNRATEREKWQDYVTAYRRAWGIQHVTEQFIRDWGTRCGSEAVNLVFACLIPQRWAAKGVGNIARDRFPVKVRVLSELVAALGLRHILDYETTFDVEARREQLMETAPFREWDHTYKLFRPQCKRTEEGFSTRHHTDTIRGVLGVCELVMKGYRDRKGGGVKERRDYMSGKEECNIMLELAALKYRQQRNGEREASSGSTCGNQNTQGYPTKDPGYSEILEGVEIVRFSDLL